VTYPLRRGEFVNFVGVVERDDWQIESWTAQGTREECARDFAGWHPDVQCLIDNMDAYYGWALLSRPTLDRWSTRQVALLGDACHPMLPFMAQGAVMALEDALVLARCVAEQPSDPVVAFSAYEAARVDRANRCVLAAERNREVFHSDRLANAVDAQRYVSTHWTEEKVEERYDWLFSYDALNCPLG
jgi:salicylate hydroxylase